jgi:cytochrome c-type biogenesis protein CcmE
MTRSIAALAVAVGFSMAIGVSAQDTKTTTVTKTDGDKAQTITYTGCVQSGNETKTWVLGKVMPVSRSTETTVGTAGTTTTTTTSYALVPGEEVEIQQHVGQKVEVSGIMIPAGESKTTTTTKVEREDAPDSKTKETVKSDNALPQFRVTSIKKVADSCD